MDNSLIEQIRHANDIVDVISSYIPLKKSGSTWRGVCPFHNDTHPSLNVSQSKQIFKCFSCGKAGNVFTFVQEFEHLTFIEAAKKLALRTGIVIPEGDKTKIVSSKRDELLTVYKLAQDYFSHNLFTNGQHVLEYLAKRSFSEETVKQLGLGYALNSQNGLKNYLLKQGIAVSLLKESKLFGDYQNNLVDLFRERLMFPIHNSSGDVVAFGGRVLDSSNEPNKYINSPSSELYTKGKELYGLYKTKYDIGKFQKVIVCEGYMDFLRIYQSGIVNCVASLGTSLTEDQVYMLARYTDNVYMMYDGDYAGIKSAVRAAHLILSKGLNPYIIKLPDTEDPDSFTLKYGIDHLRDQIDQGLGIIEFIAKDDSLGLTVQDKIEQLIDSIRQVKNLIRRDLLIKEVAESFKIRESSLYQKINQRSSMISTGVTQAENINTNIEERYLIILMMKDKKNYNYVAQNLTDDYFLIKEYRNLYKFLTEIDRSEHIDEPSSLLDEINDSAGKELLGELLFDEILGISVEDALEQVKVRKWQDELDSLNRKIKETPQAFEDLNNQKKSLMLLLRKSSKKIVHKTIH